ncbi:magnesium chelatase family protein [Salibacterium halotolerans]|uniref:Magnesium chelatase family protein n=1 Tax=Salibacterium halotolerans TaxID=1884432 RepID=A0A1I5VVA7_9BACI|nr:magnesium chelatase family protein [Salibacterium halotolerans]
MTVSTNSIGLQGLDGFLVQVKVRSLAGMESVHVIGLPDASVKESRDRVIAALDFQGCSLPEKKVIIHLAPAEQKKNGPSFDLAIAIALMQMTGHIHHPVPGNTAFLGALSLNGEIRPVNGILPAILAAKKLQVETLYLPADTSLPLDLIDGISLCFVSHLSEVLSALSRSPSPPLSIKNPQPKTAIPRPADVDFHQIYGQETAKRALKIAAAGGHHILLTGPPGCGKSLLGEAFPTLFPEISTQAQLEVMSVYELGDTDPPRLPYPPFRHPHHSSSAVSLIGEGAAPKPGEVSLANYGILFLDEMAEFPKKTLDMLRQPLEAEKVTISRVQATVTYPAQFLLIGAVNPCPCGSLGSRHHSAPARLNKFRRINPGFPVLFVTALI